MDVKYLPAGDRAITVEFSRDIDPVANTCVHRLDLALQKSPVPGIEEVQTTVRSLLVYYDPEIVNFEELKENLKQRMRRINEIDLPPKKIVNIPCCYEDEHAPDLEYVAAINHLEPAEVVQIHSATLYRVYCFGTAPGSPNMGITHSKIATPRRPSPRASMPPGAVAIGGKQCVFYIVEIPGGHWMIGRTPVRLYHFFKPLHRIIEMGDTVQFYPIGKQEFKEIAEQQYESDPNTNLRSAPPSSGGTPAFEVIKPGLLTTIQDLGRYGYQKYGVAVTGAMDGMSLRAANRVVGNDEGEAALEITLMGPRFQVLNDILVAVMGADLDFQLNGQSVGLGKPVSVQKGDVLRFGNPRSGCRAYLAVAGGIDVPVVLGSRSTFLRASIGGIEGRALKTGDILYAGKMTSRPVSLDDIQRFETSVSSGTTDPIRVVPGPQDDYFTKEAIRLLFSSVFTVSNQTNREGCRLEGPTISHVGPTDIISDGTPPGSIQILPSGNPLIFFRERQIGGYPKIGVIITADLDRFAQSKPGNVVRFEAVTLDEAHAIYKNHKNIWIQYLRQRKMKSC